MLRWTLGVVWGCRLRTFTWCCFGLRPNAGRHIYSNLLTASLLPTSKLHTIWPHLVCAIVRITCRLSDTASHAARSNWVQFQSYEKIKKIAFRIEFVISFNVAVHCKSANHSLLSTSIRLCFFNVCLFGFFSSFPYCVDIATHSILNVRELLTSSVMNAIGFQWFDCGA